MLSLSVLQGCVVAPPAQPNYGTRGPQPLVDPHEWHVVSVEPVARAPAAQAQPQQSSPAPASSAPAYAPQSTYVPAPLYAPAPVYVAPYYPAPYYPAPYYPYYAEPDYYPRFTIGLDFLFGGWHGGHGWGRASFRGPHGR